MAKVFQIFVPDNTLVSRIISCENQVTELYVIDRADKNFVSDYSSDLTKPALYILVNRDKKQLYIGETDDSIKRLRNHEAKDFWTEAIVFHSTGDTLSTTEVKWLEAKTFETLKELGYYDLSENKQKPQYPPLKRNQIYTLEPIFEEAKNYICAAGFDFFLRGNNIKVNHQVSNSEREEQQAVPITSTDIFGKCTQRLMKVIGLHLTKKGRSAFVSQDGEKGYVIKTSKAYKQGKREKYWFAYRKSKDISDCSQQYIVYGCKDERTLILMPVSEIENNLQVLNDTKDASGNSLYWHIVFLKDSDGKVTWLLSKPKVREIDITSKLL